MVWEIKFDDASKKDLAKLDKQAAKRITSFLRNRVAMQEDPRSIGKALQGSQFSSLWRYRVGDYRIIASIEDNIFCVLVVRIAHRSKVYQQPMK